MKITLKDGSVFEGTAEEYAELAKLVEGIAETEECNTPNFEVGDYVVALPSADEKYLITTTEMRLGKVREVQDDLIRIEILSHSTRKGFVGDTFYVNSKYFRKATDEEVAKFKNEYIPKEGDIVVITGNTNGSINKVGDIGRVGERLGSEGVQVHVPGKPNGLFGGNYTKFEEMRPATEEEKEDYYAELRKSEFKDGDYARIKLDVKHDGYAGGGDIVKLHDNPSGGYDFKVVKVGGNVDDEYTFFDACDLEKVSEEEKQQYEQAEKLAKIGRKPGEFKKGDIVSGHRYDDELCKFTGEVEDVSDGMIGVIAFDRKYHAANKGDCELIAPVESRVDRVD